ncbi:MAG: peptidoglycan-binding protein [Candidatus Fimadaptatus sp.]
MKRLVRAICVFMALLLLPTSAALADLKRGDAGDDVTELQLMLFESGWLFELPDGKFGGNTEQAVKDYEKYAGLKVDGVADDEMIAALRADWQRLMQELGPDEGGEDWPVGDGMYPAFCNVWTMSGGSSEIDYCETHIQIYHEAMELMMTGDADDARAACDLWQAEIERQYDRWYELCGEEQRDAVQAARALFVASVEARRAAIEGLYAGYQIEPDAAQAEYALELSLREHASWLCALLSGILAAGDEGV